VALLWLAVCACGRPPRDPVERLIHDVSAAVESGDVAAVGERLEPDFRGEGGMTKADALAAVRRYLAAYERVDVEVYDVSWAPEGEDESWAPEGEDERRDEGRLSFRVDFTGKPRDVGGLAGLLPAAALYEFDLELSGRESHLRVRSAEWRPWSPPDAQ
jgi:hypothetical protein